MASYKDCQFLLYKRGKIIKIKEGTIFESISKLIEYSGYTNYQVQKMIKEGKILYVND